MEYQDLTRIKDFLVAQGYDEVRCLTYISATDENRIYAERLEVSLYSEKGGCAVCPDLKSSVWVCIVRKGLDQFLIFFGEKLYQEFPFPPYEVKMATKI